MKSEPIPDGTLLIYAPVPLFRGANGELHVEAQAVNGLRLWAKHFGQVIAMMPLDPGPPPVGWIPLSATKPALARVQLEPLPMAYRPDQFARHLPATLRRIRALIRDADYLSFAIGGLFGDWGAVSAFVAHRMNRPFAVWTDRVESEVVRRSARSGSWRQRIRSRLTYRPMAWLERAVVRRASLGLFHGKETFEAYARYCRGRAEIVHDIHIAPSDHIGAEALRTKAEAAAQGPLRIVYVGRADAMKGPLDWIEVLERLARQGVEFRARWIGDGFERPAMLQRIAGSGLADRVDLPGWTTDRDQVLAALRDAQVFLFCHKTPESPRCLIEALISGCPIVGYASAFPEDLIARHGGGLLVPQDDIDTLARTVARLSADRGTLAGLIPAAAADGAPFSDEAVFRHRSEIIRHHFAGPAVLRDVV